MPPNTGSIRECDDELVFLTREQIEEIAVPDTTHITGEEQAVQLRRKFFPTSALREILTLDIVKQILNHKCTKCVNHLQGNRPAESNQSTPERIIATDAGINLFGLLIYLRYPLLVGCFLSSYDDDSLPSPRYFSQFDLSDRHFKHLPTRPRANITQAFQDKKWNFSVPSFNDDSFQAYEKGTILPYIDETPVGKGGFGKVYRVKVHPEYCSLGSNQTGSVRKPNVEREIILARKEIIDEDAITFVKEKTALEKIATLKHLHLIQIQKTYQLGQVFNILFPYAKTNLYDYLRLAKWSAPVHPKISDNPLWEQVIGITEGLSKIITFTDPEDPGKTVFGQHLDLKPHNILIDHVPGSAKDIFKISDFGQTQFIDLAVGNTTRIVGGVGGTDAYAPPEYQESEQNRTYDVWSLAIIILEILAYAVKGVDGLRDRKQGLDHLRFTIEDRVGSSNFYTGRGTNAKVKPVITTWMDNISTDPGLDSDGQVFVRKLVGLCKLMLEPRMKRRITIEQVLSRMKEIFNVKVSDHTVETGESLKHKEEEVVVELQKVQYFPQGVRGRHSVDSSFIILGDVHDNLRIYVGSYIREAITNRKEMKLILSYQHTIEVDNNHFEIAFAALKDNYTVSLQNKSFVVDNENDARKLQTALTNHYISPRFRVEDMTLKLYRHPLEKVGNKLSQLFNKSSRESTLERPPISGLDITPLWIELWLERKHTPEQDALTPESASIGPSTQHRRARRQINPTKECPLGRIVIFCTDQIIILPFAKDCQLQKQDNIPLTKSRTLIFEPMDKKQRDFFKASFLRGSYNGARSGMGVGPRTEYTLPGIPMHHSGLYEMEKECEVTCERLELKFTHWNDAYSIYQLYKREKARWLDEIKGIVPKGQSLLSPTQKHSVLIPLQDLDDVSNHGPDDIRAALKSNDKESLSTLLDEHFKEVAQGEYIWIQELKDLGYSSDDMLELLMDHFKYSPLICFEPQIRDSTETNINNDFHIKNCVHNGIAYRRENNTTTSKSNSLLEHLAESCGLAGVAPTSTDKSKWNGRFEFEDNKSTAYITYGPENGEALDELTTLTRCHNALKGFQRAVASLQGANCCCNSYTFLRLNRHHDLPDQIEMVRIRFKHVTRFYQALEGLCKDLRILPKAKRNIQHWYRRCKEFAYKITSHLTDDVENGDNSPTKDNLSESTEAEIVHICCTAIQFLCLSFLSYCQAHCGALQPFFLDTPQERVVLFGGAFNSNQDGLVIAQLVTLTCIGDMLREPVIVFSSPTEPLSVSLKPYIKRLDLKASPEDLVDTWGPGGFVKAESAKDGDNIYAILLGDGIIKPNMESKERGKFHWSRPEGHQSLYDEHMAYNIEPRIGFNSTRKLLIGTIPVTQASSNTTALRASNSPTSTPVNLNTTTQTLFPAATFSPALTSARPSTARSQAVAAAYITPPTSTSPTPMTKVLVNGHCRMNNAQFWSNCEGFLENLGTVKTRWEQIERQGGIQVGPFGSVSGSYFNTWGKMHGTKLKSSKLAQNDQELLPFLQTHWGLQISQCTGVARRVSLCQLLADIMPGYVASLANNGSRQATWEILRNNHNIFDVFRNGTTNLQAWFGGLNEEQSVAVLETVRNILNRLKYTGIDHSGANLIVASTFRADFRYVKISCEKKSYWARLLADSEDCATFAYFTPKCLLGLDMSCRSNVSNDKWNHESGLLETAVFPYSEDISESWALRHLEEYYMGQSECRMKVDHEVVGKVPQLRVYPTTLPPAITRRLKMQSRVANRFRPSKYEIRRLRERQAVDAPAVMCFVLTAD